MATDAEIRARLMALRESLEQTAGIGAAASAVVELDQSKVGRLSRMDALQSQAMSQEAGRRRELQMRAISAALLRLENGAYGDCRECEAPIAPKRLALDPTAVLCIECASNMEQSGAQ